MTWQMRITEISGEAQGQDEQGNPITIDLTREGRFRASVEYFDDSDVATILHIQNFDFGFGITGSDALEKMRAVGQRVRDTRQLVIDQQTNVGRTFAV